MVHRVHRLVSDLNGDDIPYEAKFTLDEGYARAVVFVDGMTGELLSGPYYLRTGEPAPDDDGLAIALDRRIFEVDFEVSYDTTWDEFGDAISAAFKLALDDAAASG